MKTIGILYVFSKLIGIVQLLFSGGASGKKPPAYGRRHKRLGFNCWVGKVLEEGMATHSSILG